MSDFQILIYQQGEDVEQVEHDEPDDFKVTTHSKKSAKVHKSIDALVDVWPNVVDRLSALASKTAASATAEYGLEEIEFNIGIEGGLNIGLVTKGHASVSIKFVRTKV